MSLQISRIVQNFQNSRRKKVNRSCRFKGCKNDSNSEGIHFHKFPKDEQRCQEWVKASKNKELVGIPASKLNERAHLCTDHFQDWCFMNISTKQRLVHNAVPCCTKLEATKNLVTTEISDLNDISNYTSGDHDYSLLYKLLLSPVPVQGQSTISKTVCSEKVSNVHSGPTISQNTSILAPASISKKSCSTQTFNSFEAFSRKYTAREAELARKVKRSQDSLRKLKLRYESIKRKKRSPLECLKELLSRLGVNEQLSTFIERQVILSRMKTNGKSFTQSEKIFAYRIFNESRAAYKILREFLELPAESTLYRFLLPKLSSIDSEDLVASTENNINDENL